VSRRRLGVWLSAAIATVAGILVFAPAVASAVPGGAMPKAVPADFAKVMGYSPVTATLADGTVRTINPAGSCSVPGEGRPFDFAVACMAHDYGYDLLRYAERTGHPLNASVREQFDERLLADLRTQCVHTTTGTELAACTATADVFRAGVGFNSWRQMSGPPVDVSGLPRTAGLVLLAGIGPASLVTRGLRRIWSRRRT